MRAPSRSVSCLPPRRKISLPSPLEPPAIPPNPPRFTSLNFPLITSEDRRSAARSLGCAVAYERPLTHGPSACVAPPPVTMRGSCTLRGPSFSQSWPHGQRGVGFVQVRLAPQLGPYVSDGNNCMCK